MRCTQNMYMAAVYNTEHIFKLVAKFIEARIKTYTRKVHMPLYTTRNINFEQFLLGLAKNREIKTQIDTLTEHRLN